MPSNIDAQTRKLDSKIHLPGFVRFKFQFYLQQGKLTGCSSCAFSRLPPQPSFESSLAWLQLRLENPRAANHDASGRGVFCPRGRGPARGQRLAHSEVRQFRSSSLRPRFSVAIIAGLFRIEVGIPHLNHLEDGLPAFLASSCPSLPHPFGARSGAVTHSG
jgi:hypothetical protein